MHFNKYCCSQKIMLSSNYPEHLIPLKLHNDVTGLIKAGKSNSVIYRRLAAALIHYDDKSLMTKTAEILRQEFPILDACLGNFFFNQLIAKSTACSLTLFIHVIQTLCNVITSNSKNQAQQNVFETFVSKQRNELKPKLQKHQNKQKRKKQSDKRLH